ncbi:hypothetical protein ACFYWX_20845 [Streptomyces sp. NPDC002888]|uniref:hypothetical protein n=1 Tax=Streptomyces sp. NPDC002888 TaxID=3364668 RepID=UPI0036AB4CAA
MHTRALGMPSRRARTRSTRLPGLALATAAALAVSLLPAASAVADETRPTSTWGPHSPDFAMPAMKAGPNKPVASRPSAPAASLTNLVLEGQGDVPWHRFTTTA